MQNLPPPFSTSAQHVAGSTVGGCGGFFLTDMIDDNDLFAYAANQKQVPTKVNPSAVIPLPVTVIREALEINESAPSGIIWKMRPRHHFATERAWKIRNKRDAGNHAGARFENNSIYYRVKINDVSYMSHRIVFLLANGIDPVDSYIDHRNPSLLFPNVAANLRLATHTENMRNRGPQTCNTSGTPGVHWSKAAQKWHAQIRINGKNAHLGFFADKNDAIDARKAAEVECFGEFSYSASQKINTNANAA